MPGCREDGTRVLNSRNLGIFFGGVMSDDEKGKDDENAFEVDLGKGTLGGLFKGFNKLIDLAEKLQEAGGEIKGEKKFKIKGHDDLGGVFGFRVRSGIAPDGTKKPIIEPFGNIKKKGKKPVVESAREPMVDMFDEGDAVQIVAEIPGVEESDIKYEVKGDIVVLTTSGKRRYSKEILLSAPVDEKTAEGRYTNGIFQLKLKKKT